MLKAEQERKTERDIVFIPFSLKGCLLLGSLKLPRNCLPSFFVDGMRPTVQTYNVMNKGLLKEGLSDEAYELFRKMEDDGYVLDRINRVKLYIQKQGETVLFFCNFQVERNVCCDCSLASITGFLIYRTTKRML
ncbi:hypothetical protein NC651_012532 [Populus alba x Populus x berolinensis]|nr:hypothetical protein NC651_012532 [Populus alba x Populus x berolinensis]